MPEAVNPEGGTFNELSVRSTNVSALALSRSISVRKHPKQAHSRNEADIVLRISSLCPISLCPAEVERNAIDQKGRTILAAVLIVTLSKHQKIMHHSLVALAAVR